MGRITALVLVSAALLLAAGSRAPAAPQAGSLLINDPFITMPVWDDVYNAPWNTNAGQISWSIEPTGGAPDSTGNTSYLRVLRNEAGSSVVVKQYTVPQNTDIYVGTWMRCPSTYSPAPGENYWMEASFKIGAWGGQNFDDPATGASWFPLLMKFSYTGGNPLGNNNIWTWYVSSAPKNSGASTTVSVAYKVGSLYDTVTYAQPPPGPDIGYDGIYVSDTPMVSPPAPPPPVPPSPPPPGGGTPPATGAARQKDNKPCGCSTAGVPGSGSAWLALLLSAALLTIRRR